MVAASIAPNGKSVDAVLTHVAEGHHVYAAPYTRFRKQSLTRR